MRDSAPGPTVPDPTVPGLGLSDQSVSGLAVPLPRWNPALLVLVSATAAALAGLAFLKAAPHRLASGEPVFLTALLQGPSLPWGVSLLALLGGLLLLALRPPRGWNLWAAALLAAALPAALVALAASIALDATLQAVNTSPLLRVSLGAGFWLALLLALVMLADARQRLRAQGHAQLWVLVLAVLPVLALLASGRCDALSLLKEYALRADDFGATVLRHVQIVGIAMAFALAIGLPLGWAAYRHGRLGRALLPVLNVVQTLPSLALFGLLMAPLAWLGSRWPSLGQAGISGVGLVPGVLALVLYSLLPVVRGMLTGLAQVPSAALQAATGLGMSAGRVFWQVEVPLALPVVLGSVRAASIQAVGLAAVTALIGAGGLGTLMFEGLFANAQDLVLLGVLPLIALGALLDLAFSGVIGLVGLTGLTGQTVQAAQAAQTAPGSPNAHNRFSRLPMSPESPTA